MKTTLILATLIFLSIFTALGYPSHHAGIPSDLPAVPSKFLPGHSGPSLNECTFSWPDTDSRYCAMSNDLYITVRADRIVHVSVYIYDSGVKAGDLLALWGEPSGAEYYGSGSVMLYWPGKMAYILVRGHFSAYSRVGFYGLGENEGKLHQWRGFWAGR